MKPLLVIVGETASGKSAYAMDLAQRYSGEIICADSRTVYREMNIGTAKPTARDRALVPHHLLDVVSPAENFNASQFKELAMQKIQEISARGNLPILVGGTGLYVDSILYDYSFRPPAELSERKRLNALTVEELQTEIRLKQFTMPSNDKNKRHLTRLLEADGVIDLPNPLRQNTLILGCQIERAALRGRLRLRTKHMIDDGLEEEVADLVSKYGWGAAALNGIGYREWHDYFSGMQNLQQTEQEINSDSLNLAKRQRTWFKRNSSIHWSNDRSELDAIVTTFLNK